MLDSGVAGKLLASDQSALRTRDQIIRRVTIPRSNSDQTVVEKIIGHLPHRYCISNLCIPNLISNLIIHEIVLITNFIVN